MRFSKLSAGALLSLAVFSTAANAHAQAVTSPVAAQCVSISSNLRVGSRDYSSGGGVTALQNFLAAQGYFNSAYIGGGIFGPLTYRAVVQYQISQGLPATGYVGVLTRAAIARWGCITPTPTPSPVTTPVTIYSITPTQGPTGTQVSVTGFGFTSDNTILMDGNVAARNVPITSSIAIACTTNPSCHGGINQTLTFTVPTSLSPNCPAGSMCPMYMRQVTPGNYAITVMNSNGTSNPMTFAVTSASVQSGLSINGLDAPTTLALGQSGSWTVHVLAGSGTGTLHFAVVWGDEASYATAGIMAPSPASTQTSSTFTHSYARSGTYYPIFTVTDDTGKIVTVSSAVTVTPLY